MKSALLVLAWIALAVTATAHTIEVPRDRATIQAGINAADEGDCVLVAPGTYRENIDFMGKSITLSSASGPEVTIIDGGQQGPVVTFETWEGRRSVLEGFTLYNGSGRGIASFDSDTLLKETLIKKIRVGGAIYCHAYTAPTLRNNIFRENRGADQGGAVFCGSESKPLLKGNRFIRNQAQLGGGIFCRPGSAPTIRENIFFENKAGRGCSIFCDDSSFPSIIKNLLAEPDNEEEAPGERIELETQGATLTGNIYG